MPRQAREQYRISAQFRAQRLRQEKLRPQAAQVLEGSAFMA